MTLWKVDDAARYLGIRPKTLYEWVRTGRVPHRKLGFNVRFDPEELRDWATRQGGSKPVPAEGKEPMVRTGERPDSASIEDLRRVAREAARELRRLESSLGEQLTFPRRRALADLAERLAGAADLTPDAR